MTSYPNIKKKIGSNAKIEYFSLGLGIFGTNLAFFNVLRGFFNKPPTVSPIDLKMVLNDFQTVQTVQNIINLNGAGEKRKTKWARNKWKRKREKRKKDQKRKVEMSLLGRPEWKILLIS